MIESREVHVKGLSELNKFFDQLPVKLRVNVMRGALRAGARPILRSARSKIHSVSGELARGLQVSTNLEGRVAKARIRARGKHGYIARWVEYGTKAHWILARIAKALAVGGGFLTRVRHPGSQAKPFMRPALDEQAGAAVIATAIHMRERLRTKAGLDVPDIDFSLMREP